MKNNKKSLLLSVTALILCCALLAGTTLAWFSDSAETQKNQILAGNLDLEVQFKNAAITGWTDLHGAANLFVQNTLWEPGHMEYVLLKVENAGTLALDYTTLVYAAAEREGYSVNSTGTADIKLSNILKFALGDITEAQANNFTRTDAMGVINSAGFSVGAYSSKKQLEANSGEKYLALVVYMPEMTSNEANYLKGTEPPYIDLAIRMEATQSEFEADSFGTEYDKNADGMQDHPEFGNGAQTVEVALKAIPVELVDVGGNLVEKSSGDTTVEAGGAKVTYTQGALLTTDNVKNTAGASAGTTGTSDARQGLVLTGTQSNQNFRVVSDNNTLEVYELSLPVARDNDKLLKIEKADYPAGKNVVRIGHNATELTKVNNASDIPLDAAPNPAANGNNGYFMYDNANGGLTIWVFHPSEIAIEHQAKAAAIGSTQFDSLKDAIQAAQPGDSITMLDSETSDGVQVSILKDMTIDFAGNTYHGAVENGSIMQNSDLVHLTLRDSKGTGGIDSNIVIDPIYHGMTQFSAVSAWQGIVTIESGKYTHDNAVVHSQLQTTDENAFACIINGGTFTGKGAASVISNAFGNVFVNGGQFYANDDGDASGECVYVDYGNRYVPSITTINNGTFNATKRIFYVDVANGYVQKIIVNGGKFNVAEGGSLIVFSKTVDNPKDFLTITGGTFNVDPSDYVDTNVYAVTQNGSTWTVTKK